MADGPGITLVAFLGETKPPPLRRLVEGLHQRVGAALAPYPGLWRPTPLARVHATLVGLEATRVGDALFHRNALARQRRFGVPAPAMDLPGLLEGLRRRPWPVTVRFGGHPPGARNPHDPRPPWERAFELRAGGPAVLIGWPCSAAAPFQPALFGLRKAAERHGVVHKYHVEPGARDNDLFLVVGAADAREHGPLARARDEVRRWLEHDPVEVALGLEHLRVIEYQSTTLETVSFERPLAEVDPGEVLARYRDE